MKVKIRLDTMDEIRNFVTITTKIPYDIHLEDGTGYRVSAKSILGAMATLEWNNLYCLCEHDIYTKIDSFIVEE